MLYVLVIVLFSGQAVVFEHSGLDEHTCRAVGEQAIASGQAATFACLERADA